MTWINHQNRQNFLLSDNPKIYQSVIIYSSILLFSFLEGSHKSVTAQISADDTVSTEVDNSNNISEITGGTKQGANLFHSFQEFSVPSGNTAFFNNGIEIGNIVSRVTGGSISTIDGLIRANGTANLILINPRGINFGANAQLDIGGSFLGSTADSLVFEDGTIYSATNPNQSPLLTVSAPVGLQLGQNSGAINVQGTGHNLTFEIPVFSPFTRGEVSGLKVQPGQTLGLVGGDISLTGGVLVAETGEIELGSVAEGTVKLDFGEQGFSLGYEDISAFKNINLAQQALVDVSGINSGSVEIQGNNISLTEGSGVLIQNLGAENSGNLRVNAAESLSVDGISPDGIVASGLYTEALAGGKGGEIAISTPKLEVLGGGSIFTDTFSTAASGNIKINATDSFHVEGFATINPNKFSTVSAQSYGAGDAGAIDITTKSLTALDGGNIASITGGIESQGSGGNITINAAESIELVGINPIVFAPSQITAGSGSAGNAGNVNLETKNLTVRDGGRVDASATATGNAGNVNIDASESIMVTGTVPDSLNPSLIVASANILNPELRELFGLPDVPSGNSGSITIDTPQLKVMDGGQVTVRNDGTGNGGNLEIKANSIELSNQGGITAAVQEGLGGTINLEIEDSLTLTSGGQISSDNFGTGDGGNITIAANDLSISDRSFITTTTFGSGKGGDITLDIAESINLTGIGFEQFQQTFQAAALDGSLKPGTRGTGIFIGTAADGMGGNLKIDTNFLSLMDGGIIFSPIFSNGIGGDIEVNATDIEIVGSALQIGAGVDSNDSASAGNILIDTQGLMIRDGGTIVNATFGDGTGGNIDINATEFVDLKNTPDGSLLFTGIYANTSIGRGTGGDIHLKTGNLFINDAFVTNNTGGFIRDGLVFDGGGNGGNISVEVADTIEITGIPTDPRFGSGIFTSSFTSGAAGNIDISTNKLLIRDGSGIETTAVGSGAGGDLTISATDSIQLFGTTNINDMKRGGLLATSGSTAFPEQQADGTSGNITISTGNLIVQNGASIDVQSLGTGSAGNLDINVENSILLDSMGVISAATNSNTGGNIDIVADNIFSRGNSTITATASNNANGGNITIQTNNLVALESSKLTADANIGQGGNININTQGLFLCESCRISASSQLGVDGIITINTLDPNPNLEIVDIPIKLTQPEDTVALACSVEQKPNASKLTISGRGGLPPRPNETLTSESIVSLGVPNNQAQTTRNKNVESNSQLNPQLPNPARNWYVNSQGIVVLTASSAVADSPQFNSPNCDVR